MTLLQTSAAQCTTTPGPCIKQIKATVCDLMRSFCAIHVPYFGPFCPLIKAVIKKLDENLAECSHLILKNMPFFLRGYFFPQLNEDSVKKTLMVTLGLMHC